MVAFSKIYACFLCGFLRFVQETVQIKPATVLIIGLERIGSEDDIARQKLDEIIYGIGDTGFPCVVSTTNNGQIAKLNSGIADRTIIFQFKFHVGVKVLVCVMRV
jgi:hypothetical protein